ncbi:lipoxygenase family protein [Archangium violaceum]|uniref:lipoxygenase family protein n=1 Tax=Archangium violaceum TaxID=83451 RepID=UPI0035E3CB79
MRPIPSLPQNDDAAVRSDYELQAWVTELSSPEAGKLKDVGENGGGIQTFEYLVDLATYVIFTASVQHAAVNFPQRTVMSYTPALPLAAYAPAPTSVEELPASTELTHLPPLQMAFLQQAPWRSSRSACAPRGGRSASATCRASPTRRCCPRRFRRASTSSAASWRGGRSPPLRGPRRTLS